MFLSCKPDAVAILARRYVMLCQHLYMQAWGFEKVFPGPTYTTSSLAWNKLVEIQVDAF